MIHRLPKKWTFFILVGAMGQPLLKAQELPVEETGSESSSSIVTNSESEKVERNDESFNEEEDGNKAVLEDPFRPRYVLESIEIKGNQKSRGSLIISKLLLRPGEVLDEDLVEWSRIRLLASGYFKEVRMSLDKGSKRGWVRWIVEVEERNTIIMDDLFLGFSETHPFWGGIGISDINFLGRGVVLSGGFVASKHQGGGRVGLFWPSVFNSRVQAGVQLIFSLGSERVLTGATTACDPEPNANCWYSSSGGTNPCDQLLDRGLDLPYLRAGGILTGGIRLDASHRVMAEWHGEHIEADMGGERNCPNNLFEGFLRDGQSTLSSLSLRFERDTRDDLFLPTHGMLFTVGIELASRIFGSDYEFSKYLISYEQSFQPWSDHAVRLTLVGGLLQQVGEVGSPFFSRFYQGDYAFFLIDKKTLPRNLELNFSGSVYYGDLLASVTLEYDIPIWSTGKLFYRGYAFATVNFCVVDKAEFLGEGRDWEGSPRNPVTFDLGFKIDSPIGLLKLSLGYMLDLVY